MRILFWNTKNNGNINPYIASLVRDNDIDVLVTAEYNADKSELHKMLEGYNHKLFSCNTRGCNRINVWSNFVDMESCVQDTYHSIHIMKREYILCCAHLITDLYGDCSDDRLEIIQRIMHDVQLLETETNCHRIIIIGDFNEAPYGKGCLNANGFHGLPSLDVKDSPTRQVRKKKYQKFYNPMWNLLGDHSYPPGTYYLNKAQLYSPMWYILDQVIVSKAIVPLFEKESLKIITSCSYGELADTKGHPNKKISDHFPIMCEIRDV